MTHGAGTGSDAADSAARHHEGASGSTGKPKRNGFLALLREIALILVISIVLSFVIKTFFFKAFYIPSESMVPTLEENDRIFVNLMVPRNFALQRGDVIVFKDTKGWLPPSTYGEQNWFQESFEFIGLLPDTSQQHLIKRLIGLPGDHVVCCDAQQHITVNGAALSEPYVNPAEIPRPVPFDVTVPAGKVWVMGDNRNHSSDSRYHNSQEPGDGFIDRGDIEGQAVVIAWPLNRLTALGNYPSTFSSVPNPK
ncbi:signal peptidase I [Sinomonas sp. ASV322]|uniref:signal peptidase I n=1 Tax=Sinomonas sp. ASV322 TaxID=3041920 RepID=UPI0027DE95BC|nr:signal peptidase I [Sinomonas sp. ASV322]MDQ4502267.1 signal peptidase I [Sinomonas sp. ASV322]